jgi:hypothetical protein
MTPKTLQDYGAPKADALPIEDPTTQLASDEFNQLAEDCAQLTRTAPRAIVWFIASASPTIYKAVSVWGSGLAQQPTITHPSAGQFVITYPATMINGLGVSEPLNFNFAHAQVLATVGCHARINQVASNDIWVWTLDPGFNPFDPGVGVTAWIY